MSVSHPIVFKYEIDVFQQFLIAEKKGARKKITINSIKIMKLLLQ